VHKEGSFPTFIGFITNPPRDVRRTTHPVSAESDKAKNPTSCSGELLRCSVEKEQVPREPLFAF
jgi:hypothetical protein